MSAARRALGAAALLVAAGCERDVVLGGARAAAPDGAPGDAAPSRDSGGGGPRDGAPVRPDAGPAPCKVTSCGARIYACGDCVDNDGDDASDMADPDCLGPCHDSEDSFYATFAGQARPLCGLDCYFDADNGIGNDSCRWDHRCDPLAVAPDFPPSGDSCAYEPSTELAARTDCSAAFALQEDTCRSGCLPLTPNGCDCFGCCAVPGAPTPVFLGSEGQDRSPSCDRGHLGDPERCRPCTQVPSCLNPCETCELCVGKASLPPSCEGAGSCPAPSCPEGRAACGLDCLPPCPGIDVCITGCCVEPPR